MLRNLGTAALIVPLLLLSPACSLPALEHRSNSAFGLTDFDTSEGLGVFYDDGLDGDLRARAEGQYAVRLEARIAGSRKGASVQLPQVAQVRRRKMIYSAGLSIEVARVDEAMKATLLQVEKLGGYMQERQGSSLVLRVPAASFTGFVESLRELGRVLNESIKAQDVSKEHKNLEIRLENARRSRKRLIALLDTAKAVSDILAIEKALQRVTVDIEQFEAALEAMNGQIAYSSVRVVFNAALGRRDRRRRRSRFEWINRVGLQHVLNYF